MFIARSVLQLSLRLHWTSTWPPCTGQSAAIVVRSSSPCMSRFIVNTSVKCVLSRVSSVMPRFLSGHCLPTRLVHALTQLPVCSLTCSCVPVDALQKFCGSRSVCCPDCGASMLARDLSAHQASGCGPAEATADAPWMEAVRQQLAGMSGAGSIASQPRPQQPLPSEDFECVHCPNVFKSFEGLQCHVEEEHAVHPKAATLNDSAMELATPPREDECEYVYRCVCAFATWGSACVRRKPHGCLFQ
jgi:hypothetical protein